MSIHQPGCGATIFGATGITPCDCDTTADLRNLADVIRREVRLSAGIPEGHEFRCDWTHVAESVLATVRGIGKESTT